ncbi:hypothetical protein D9M68_406480 [compost metagenome]
MFRAEAAVILLNGDRENPFAQPRFEGLVLEKVAVLRHDEVEVHAAVADMAEVADGHIREFRRHFGLHMVAEGHDVTPPEGDVEGDQLTEMLDALGQRMAQRPDLVRRADEGIGEGCRFHLPDLGESRFQHGVERLFALAGCPGAADLGEDDIIRNVAALEGVLQRRHMGEGGRDGVLRHALEGREIGAEPLFHGPEQRQYMGAACRNEQRGCRLLRQAL